MASSTGRVIQHRRGTAAAWIAANPVLIEGELGLELDTGRFKFGNGVTPWVDLGYFNGADTGTGPLVDDETVQDVTARLLLHTGHSGVTATYDDAANRVLLNRTDTASVVPDDAVRRRRCINGVWDPIGTVTAAQTLLWIKYAATDPDPVEARDTDVIVDNAPAEPTVDTGGETITNPPGAPTGVTALAGDASATVSFTPPVSDGGALITGYRVTSTPGAVTVVGAASPITITGLVNGTSYTFTVAAQNSAGYGPESASSAAITPTAASSITYNDLVMSDGPVGFWIDGAGTEAVAARNAALVGTPATALLPNGDSAFLFNGTTQYAEVADNDLWSIPTTGRLTIEAWMRPDVLQFPTSEGSGYVHWLGKGAGTQHEWALRMHNETNTENLPNRVTGYAFNSDGAAGTGAHFQDVTTAGAWIHVTLVINSVDKNETYRNGYVEIIKNGVSREKVDLFSSGTITPGNGTDPVRFGTRNLVSYFQGAIGKVAIYNKVLPVDRALAHYKSMTGT